MKIIHEDNKILVVEKPFGIPVQADITGDEDLLSLLKQFLKDKYNKPGNAYLGLVHRLDRPVGGVMVFAKNSKAAGKISLQIRNKTFKKKYLVVVEGIFENKEGTLINYFRKNKDIKKSAVFNKFISDTKEGISKYKVLDSKENLSLLEVELITGRYHQIRSQFAHINHPVVGDFKYGSKIKLNEDYIKEIALLSYEIEFEHSGTLEIVKFNSNIPNKYPWNLFTPDL